MTELLLLMVFDGITGLGEMCVAHSHSRLTGWLLWHRGGPLETITGEAN
ncbi:MAG: hypothetical protein ACYC3W_04455 [Candidatus Nanopelagicales bacterium]